MPCVHLKQLFQLCEDNNIRMGGSDVIHLVCEQCGKQEVCPDMLMDEYDARSKEAVDETSEAGAGRQADAQ